MDLAFVKKVLKLVEESNVNEIELEEKGVRIRITKNANNVGVLHQMAPAIMPQQLPARCTRVQPHSGRLHPLRLQKKNTMK